MSSGFFNREERGALTAVAEAEDGRFSNLVKVAGLDPAMDLKGVRLHRIVVQPGEDLSGFDLSGADLSGAVLRRVDLTDVALTNALLHQADLRGAEIRTDQLSSDQGADADLGPLPPALAQGPNRSWPPDLRDRIDAILAEIGDSGTALFNRAFDILEEDARLAEALFQICRDWRRALGQGEDSHTLTTQFYVARAVLEQDRAAEAEALFRALLPLQEKVIGAEHPHTLITRHELARAVLDQGRAAEAEALFRALLPVEEKVNGAEHRDTLIARLVLSQTLLETGAVDDARALLEAIPAVPKDLPPRHLALAALLRAWLADLQGDADGAAALLDEAERHLDGYSAEHVRRRHVARYRETRTPGGAGGTTIPAAERADSEGAAS